MATRVNANGSLTNSTGQLAPGGLDYKSRCERECCQTDGHGQGSQIESYLAQRTQATADREAHNCRQSTRCPIKRVGRIGRIT